ncbi:hypothetical protein D3C71_1912780 [compost metagenome]
MLWFDAVHMHIHDQVFIAFVRDMSSCLGTDLELLALQRHAEPLAEALGIGQRVPHLSDRGVEANFFFNSVCHGQP